MAVKTLYLKNVTVNSALSLQDGGTSPATGITGTGWTVAKVTTPNYSTMTAGLKKASTGFVTTDQLGGTFTAASCFRSEQPFTGAFANTNWSFVFPMRAVSAASSQTGQVRIRLWRSTNADGTGATQITSATQAGTTTAALSTSTSSNSTVTYAPGAILTFANQYLWVMVEWFVSVASGSNNGDAVFNIETAGAITTPDFTQQIGGSATLPSPNSTLSGAGGIFATGTGALPAQVSAITATGTAVSPPRAIVSWVELSGAQAAGATTGTGALVAQNSTLAGAGAVLVSGTGTLPAQSSVIVGSGTVASAGTVTGTGALAAGTSLVVDRGSGASITGSTSWGEPSNYTSYGTSFIAAGSKLTSASFYLGKGTAGVSDGVVASVFSGNMAVPPQIGTSSNTIPASSVTLSSVTELTFDFASPVDLIPGTTYSLIVVRTGALDAANYYLTGFTNISPYADGSLIRRDNFGIWSGLSTYDLPGKITFNTGSAVAGSGTVSTADITGTGVLVVEDVTGVINFALQSETLDVSPWSTNAISVTANAAPSPIGTADFPAGSSTAELLTDTTANAPHAVYQSITLPFNNKTVTYSIYAKAGTLSWLQISGLGGWSNFNLSTGTLGNSSVSPPRQITPVGGGWYRCSVSGPAGGTATVYYVLGDSDLAQLGSYTGTGTGTIYVWGAQVEKGVAPAAYVTTTTVAVAGFGFGTVSGAAGITGTGALVATPFGVTNLFLQSQTMNVSPWSVGGTVTANAIAAPDSTTTAEMVTDAAGGGFYGVTQSGPLVGGAPYSLSVYAKAGTLSWLQLATGLGPKTANFDLVNGVTGKVSSGVTSQITAMGSGWYRCSMFFTPLATFDDSLSLYLAPSDITGIAFYTGSGTGTLYLWGAQLQTGSATTEYLPTTTATVTKDYTLVGAGSVSGATGITGTGALAAQSSALSGAGITATHYRMLVSTGAIALAGTTTGLRRGLRVVAGTGAVALTGTTTTLRRTYNIVAATGAVTLTGTFTGLNVSSIASMPVLTGTITLTGNAAKLAYGRKFVVGTGAITLTGQPVALLYKHAIKATTGAITLTGSTTGLRVGRSMPVVKGSITLTGSTTTLAYKQKWIVARGQITLTGTTTLLTYSGAGARVMPVATGAITLTGKPVALSIKHILAASTGTILLSGAPVVLRYSQSMRVLPGSITLTRYPAVLRRGYTFPVTTMPVTLTGRPVNLTVAEGPNKVLRARTGTVVLFGPDVELRQTFVPAVEVQPGPLNFGYQNVYLNRW